MEKVNVYDWDKTIFPVDSTVAFVRWCLRRHPGVIWPLLCTRWPCCRATGSAG